MLCPKCQYQRQFGDSSHPDICPACGIVYSKYIQKHTKKVNTNKEYETISEWAEPKIHWKEKCLQAIFYVPDTIPKEAFVTRCCLLIVFSVWGLSFIIGGTTWENSGSSFMHNVNLPFHEFGHVLFIPLGEFMTILGGSLFQIMMPLICTLVFIFKQKDTFAASITFWWVGQSFIDLSPYIADARDRALPLIGGLGEEAHDWGNLLTMMNLLNQTEFIANASFLLGSIIIISAMLWGGWLLKTQQKNIVFI